MSPAFQGSPAAKQALLATFDSAPDDATYNLHKLASDSAGYPEALVRFLDRLIKNIANGHVDGRDAARTCARRCLDAVTPGADLGAVPGNIMVLLLRDIDARADLGTAAPVLHDLFQCVVDLHTPGGDGDDLSHRKWAAIRNEAMALTDIVQPPVLKCASQAVEAAAWDLTTSSGVLLDVLKAFQDLILVEAALAWGWTDVDERRSHDVLKAIYGETQSQRDADEEVLIPALFRAREPELALRYDEGRAIRNHAKYAGCLALTDQVLRLLADAPVVRAEEAQA